MHFVNLLLPLAVSASVLPRQAPATGAAAPASKFPTNPPPEELKPIFRQGARRTLSRYGPYTIKASTAGSSTGKGKSTGGLSGLLGALSDSTLGGQAFFMSIKSGQCNHILNGPCSVIAGRVGVMWADGRGEAIPANGIYIHHILSSDNTKKENPWISNCGTATRPVGNIGAITGGAAYIGTGEDGSAAWAVYGANDTQASPIGEGGYHIAKDDRFTAWAQLVNYNKEDAQVYVFYDTEWVPGNPGDNIKAATLTATCGAGLVRMSETGPMNTTSGKFTFMEDGRLLGGRGHLHDGGVEMTVMLNDKMLCQSKAIYGSRSAAEGMGSMSHSHGGSAADAAPKAPEPTSNEKFLTIAGMTDCVGPFPVKKGDTLQLVGVYDLKQHPLRKSASGSEARDVMAMMGMTFAAGGQKPQ